LFNLSDDVHPINDVPEDNVLAKPRRVTVKEKSKERIKPIKMWGCKKCDKKLAEQKEKRSGDKQMTKNAGLPFVLGPALAIDKVPGCSWWRENDSSTTIK
jgi:hypothetical protein